MSSTIYASTPEAMVRPARRVFLGTPASPLAVEITNRAAGYRVPRNGVAGIGLPPRDVRFKQGAQAGSRWTGTTITNRVIDLVFDVFADTLDAYVPRLTAVEDVLDSPGGVIRVTVDNGRGDRRWVDGRYTGGDDRQSGAWTGEQTRQRFSITIECPDPYFRSGQILKQTLTPGTAKAWIPFGPPIELAASSNTGTLSLSNYGDVDAYPRWVFTGPGTQIVARLVSTGERFTINANMLGGEQRIVETDPQAAGYGVFDQAGENRYPQVVPGSVLWALPPGQSDVVVSVSGSSNATTIAFTGDVRWRSATGKVV